MTRKREVSGRARRIGLALGISVLTVCFQNEVLAKPAVKAAGLERSVQSYRQRQEDAKPDAVLAWLKEGNARFAAGKANHGGFPKDARERVRAAAAGQRPLAIVLSCIDSRTAPEIVFDTSVGDLFTVRVGGNVINDDILGSLEVTADSGAKVIVVLGHTDCAAMKAACRGDTYGHFTQVLEKVKPAIADVLSRLDAYADLSRTIGERAATNRRYIAEVGHANAVMSAKQIRERSPLLREQIERGEVLLVSAVYDVDSGRVIFDSEK